MALTRVVAVTLAAAVLGSGGCADDEPVPRSLLDGSRAVTSAIAFETVDVPVLLAKAGTGPAASADERVGACRVTFNDPDVTSWVARIGVAGESVTLADTSGVALFACDNSSGLRERRRRWCGGAYGRLLDGRLLDPRVDTLCSTADGHPVAFAWVQPISLARYVVVHQEGYAEAHEVVRTLPVRVSSTMGVDPESASARFDVTEHDWSGALIRRYTLEARVAG